MCSIESSEARLSLIDLAISFSHSFTNKFEAISNIQQKSIMVKIHYWKVHKQGDYIFQKDSLTHYSAIT